ncbi:MAG TPA: helix-turn-helix domain-containing protein [Candidatus Paceibacterota bacterium]
MARFADKLRAMELRKKGHSYNYISEVLNISKSTLSDWLAEIPYTPNAETVSRIGRARAASGEAKSKIRRDSILEAGIAAKRELGRMSQRDLFMLGLGLYVGEGSKTAEIIGFVNADPSVINLMIRWFTEAIGLPKANLRIRLHLYPDSDERRSLQYWSKITTIPVSQFQKTSFDRRTDKKATKSGKLLHGTAHLRLKSFGEKRFGVFLFRKISAWSGLVLGNNSAGVV